jgi:hypothetical protein
VAAAAVAAEPDRAERWAGLAASAAEERLPGAGVLRRRTEVVRDLYRELTTDARTPEQTRPPDPLSLAAWLTGAPESGETDTDPGQDTGT